MSSRTMLGVICSGCGMCFSQKLTEILLSLLLSLLVAGASHFQPPDHPFASQVTNVFSLGMRPISYMLQITKAANSSLELSGGEEVKGV